MPARTGLGGKVRTAIRCAGLRGVTKRELLDAVYSDDASGGPDSADKCIDVALWRLRRSGFDVECVTVYRLKPRRG